MTPPRRVLAPLLVIASLFALPAVAQAGTVSIVNEGGQHIVRYVATAGEDNDLTVSNGGGVGEVVFFEPTFLTVTPGAGCTERPPYGTYVATCPTAGIDRIEVFLGDRDDVLTLTPPDGIPARAYGEAGADRMEGNLGGNRLDGGIGDDTFHVPSFSLTASDEYVGGGGHDTVSYGDRFVPLTVTIDDVANDGATGENDNVHTDVEKVIGGFDIDHLTGGPGNDELFGAMGSDVLKGAAGNDTLDAGLSSVGTEIDDLQGEAGNDRLQFLPHTHADGGADNDTLAPGLSAGGEDDIRGGSGTDVLDFSGSSFYDDTVVSLDDVANDGIGDVENFHSDIENINAGSNFIQHGMVLIGSAGPNKITGTTGDDLIRGGGGADIIEGGGGTDLADYSDHTAPVSLTIDAAANDGSTGEKDKIASDIEDLVGGDGDDFLLGGTGDNVLDGGPGADIMGGGGGIDGVDYSYLADAVTVDLDGQAGDDGLAGEHDSVAADVEGVFGGAGDDVLTGNTLDGFLVGGAGNDHLVDPGGSDENYGDEDDDDIRSSDRGIDYDECGDGVDHLTHDLSDTEDGCETSVFEEPPPAPEPPVTKPPTTIHPRLPVSPTDHVAPRPRWSVTGRKSLASLRRRGLAVAVDCDESCTTSATLAFGKKVVARGSRKQLSGARKTVTLKLTSSGRRALRKLRSGRFTLTLTVKDRLGNSRRAKRTLRLKR